MTSAYSTDLKLELMVTGENAGTWGDNTNNNLNLIQQAISGFEQVTLSSGGTLALAMTDKTISNARNMVIKFATASIAASTICTIPDSIEKFYIFDATGLTNPTNLTIKTASGTGFTLDAAKIYAAYSDGTNLNEISLDTLGGTVAAANITGTIATAQIADDAVTLAKMAPGTDGNIISYDASGNPVAVATGSSGQVLTSAGAGAPPTFADAAGGISWDTTPKTATFTAVAGGGYFANTSGGSDFNMNLPAGVAGAEVAVADYAETWDVNTLTVVPNGTDKIGSLNESAILNTKGQSVTFVFVDSTQGWINTLDSTSNVRGTPPYIAATVSGACNTLTTIDTNFKLATFTGPGTFTVTAGTGPLAVADYLVIAGGGGAGREIAGGGGAGGYREAHSDPVSGPYTASPLATPTALPFVPGAYPITVGAGGNGVPTSGPCNESPGSDSVLSTITSAGGGSSFSPGKTATGGSGGGGEANSGSQPTAVVAGNTPPVSPPQGNPGGLSSGNPANVAGGGGGAGAAGATAPGPTVSGAGGNGVATEITGSSVTRGGGGGGGEGYPSSYPSGAGGSGGGGGASGNAGQPGTTNTGGGAGGGGSGQGPGGNGGSGIVMIRYRFQ